MIYDLDRAQFDTDGKLHSVSEYQTNTNGTAGYATTSRVDYLKRLFDQYISEYNSNAKPYTSETTVHGSYYAVDVDETGYGVWLYLPDKTAIDAAAQWDQNTEKSENAQPISLNLVFKGQNQTTTTTGKEKETLKTLTATIQNRWTPTVEKVIDTTTNGLVATFRVQNTSTTVKTLVLRMQTNEVIEETTKLSVGCKVGSGDYVTVNHLTMLNEHDITVYCAMDSTNREIVWTLAPEETAEMIITGIKEEGTQNSIQLIARVCGQ